MKQAHMIVVGSYEDTRTVRVFEDQQAAEDYVVEYNSTVRWSYEDDKARVQEVDFVPAREMKTIEYAVIGQEQQ